MNDLIIQTPIVEEVEQSFLDYSLSVITDRAIPSAEDGLKPVHRRILWTMFEDGNTNDKQFRKCAEPVGNVMSKYHPHGDSSIYGALVALSQPWTMRYPLITFHGNNGSRDGDSPAAYRYTECKLSKFAEDMLRDIKKNAVNFFPNYTETREEPEYLTGSFPHLLCNGTTGIAVAMACSFLPHNLTEIMKAIKYYTENNNCTIDDLLQFISGPDFPTGGVIVNQNELRSAYATGKGKVRVRGTYKIEKHGARRLLVFDSIPYKVSKEKLIVEIDKLCEEKKIENIAEIRDESNKLGVRFVLELTKDGDPDTIVNKLYRLTQLEETYSFNQVALVGKTPKLLNFKELIAIYTKHQYSVLYNKTQFEHDKLQHKLEILNGLLKALENIDEVIAIIKQSISAAAAKVSLIQKWNFSEIQVKAILDMKLSKLAKLEREEIETEMNDTTKEISQLVAILTDKTVAKNCLIQLYDTMIPKQDLRKTPIIQVETEQEDSELLNVLPEDVVVVLTENGTVKKIPVAAFKTQKTNGKGIRAQEDIAKTVISTNTVDTLMFFTSTGQMYRLLVDKVPTGTSSSKGVPVSTLINLKSNERIMAMSSLYRQTDAKFVVFVTKRGVVKKTSIEEYKKTKKDTGVIALNLREGDEVASVTFLNEESILLITRKGMCIRFATTEVNPVSRIAIGIKGINCDTEDEIVSILPIKHSTDRLAIFTSKGYGRKVSLEEIPFQTRGGKGSLCYKTSTETGNIVGAALVDDNDMILILGVKKSICIDSKDVPLVSKSAIGNIMIKDNIVTSTVKV